MRVDACIDSLLVMRALRRIGLCRRGLMRSWVTDTPHKVRNIDFKLGDGPPMDLVPWILPTFARGSRFTEPNKTLVR